MSNTANQMSQMVGKHAMLRCYAFEILVRVMDAKQSYGQLRYHVTPENGKGASWVDASRLRVTEHAATVLP
jgi:hypothetical protein